MCSQDNDPSHDVLRSTSPDDWKNSHELHREDHKSLRFPAPEGPVLGGRRLDRGRYRRGRQPGDGGGSGQGAALRRGRDDAAVKAASRAFKPWARKSAKERSQILRTWFELIMANQEDLAQIMTAEQGKPLDEARGEVAYAASFVEFYAEEAKAHLRRDYSVAVPGLAHHRAEAAGRRARA
ncbi:aldehyde dehydrogenase family protein [Mesorhizobium sp. M0768]